MPISFPVPDIILPEVRASSAQDVLKHMTKAMALEVGADADQVYAALLAADRSGGSAIGDGVAVVGARVPAAYIGRRMSAFATLSRPVVFRGVEERPCDVVFIMVAPSEDVQKYLRDLSSVVRTMKDPDFTSRLRDTDSVERLVSLFKAKDTVLSKAA